MEGKADKTYFSVLEEEEGGHAGWMEWLIRTDAHYDHKFHPLWRYKMANMFWGVPFSILLTAFRKIQREQIMRKSPPQLQQDGIAGGSDFPYKNIEEFVDLDLDVIEEVLLRLPLPSLMRAKSVCKGWNKEITTATFSKENNEYHFVMQDMLAEGSHGIAFFSSELNRWFRIALPPLLFAHYYGKFYLCTVAAGFLLFVDCYNAQHKPFIMINPVSMQRREVPALPDYYRCTIGTAAELVVHEFGQFDIIALGFHFPEMSNYCILLYNSTTSKWTDVPIIPRLGFSNVHSWTSVVHDGVVYFTQDYGAQLGCYDIASNNLELKCIERGSSPSIDCDDHENNLHASLPSLVSCNGKLLLVGRIEKGIGASIWGRFPFIEHTLVGIWELLNNKNNNMGYWSLTSITPQDLLEDTVASSHGTDFMVAAHSNKIWLTIRGSRSLLSLDLRCMEWSALPGCPVEDISVTFPRSAVCGTLSIG